MQCVYCLTWSAWRRLLDFSLLGSAAAKAAEPYDVAAYYFPNYHHEPKNEARYGKGWNEWALVRAARPRFPGHLQPHAPAWGYEDEADPKVMAKKVDAAADHGVTSLIFDWYWYENKPFLEKCLNDGFLKAPNRQRIKFALLWCGHNWEEWFPVKRGVKRELIWPGAVSRDVFEHFTDHIVHDYFVQPNYWKIDGKPYFSLIATPLFVKGLGGPKPAREALDHLRQRLRGRAAGLAPQSLLGRVVIVGVGQGVRLRQRHFILLGLPRADGAGPDHAHPAYAEASAAAWKRLKKQWSLPYYPNVSMGWDPSPRSTQSDPWSNQGGYPYGNVLAGNTPAEFKKSLQRVKTFLDADPKGPRIFTINAWNEWTESSYLEPDTVNGMQYLEAIRDVFPPTESK